MPSYDDYIEGLPSVDFAEGASKFAMLDETGAAAEGTVTALKAELATEYAPFNDAAPRSALYFNGTSTNYASIPDDAAFDGLTQLEIVLKLTLDNWGTTTATVLAGRSATSNLTFQASITASNTLNLLLSTNGSSWTTVSSQSSLSSIGLVSGTTYWLKFTWTSTAGACTMSYAADSVAEPSSWTTITLNGAQNTGPTSALFTGTSIVTVGTGGTGGNPVTGAVHRCIIRSSIGGTKIADGRFDMPWASRYTDVTGRVWSLTGSAWSWKLGKV